MRRAVQPFVLVFAAMAALLFMAAPGEAQARWLRAESSHFVIYSDGDEATLREYARRLEIYDAVLRRGTGLPSDTPTARKLPIYLVGGIQAMRQVRPGLAAETAGFYSATGESIFAVSTRSRRQDWVLFHEYAHHFMLQHFPGAYPAWYVEGFAEYFMTVDIDGAEVTIGEPNANRGSWLVGGAWLPFDRILGRRSWEAGSGPEDRVVWYSQSWLLAHWFHGDPERALQLRAYLDRVQEGGDPVESMREVTGLSIDDLERALRSYARSALPIVRGESNVQTSDIVVTTLPDAYDDLLLPSLGLTGHLDADQRAAMLATIRQVAARHANDPFARVTLGHAELHFGDRATGVALLEALVEDHPDDVEGLIYLAMARREAAVGQPRPDAVRLLNDSNALLSRALDLSPNDYRIYYALAENRVGAATYPSENDIALRLAAYQRAPQLVGVSLGLAEALMMVGRFDEAQIVLGPLANNPHGGGASTRAFELLNLARAGQPPTPRADREGA